MGEYTKLVGDVRNAFNTGRTKSVEWRKEQLKAVDRMLVENEATFISALKADLNKPVQETIMAEIDFLRNDIIGLLREIDDWTKDTYVPKSPLTLLDTVLTHPEPFGIVLVIGAWNYPLQLSLAPMLPAIAAGNCAIVKPSEIAPATATAIAQLLPKYIDQACIKVVEGGVPETTALLKERFDYIFYTGSTPVGRIVGAAANVHLTPCTLELGGKSPTYFDDSGDLEIKVKRLLWGKFNNSGQICVAPDYILCSKATEEKLIPVMKKVLREFYGEKAEESKDYCRIVSSRHLERLKGLLAKTEGTVALGGRSNDETRFMEPTIVTGVTWQDPLMQDELFGPILPILNVNSADEAIELINQREKPLALYVFSEYKEVQDRFKQRTSSGGMLVNDTLMHLSIEQLPFGGVGQSGMGSYHGKFGFDTFTHTKPVMMRDLGWLGETLGKFRYPPYDQKAINGIRNMLKNRALPSTSMLWQFSLVALGASLGYAFSAVS